MWMYGLIQYILICYGIYKHTNINADTSEYCNGFAKGWQFFLNYEKWIKMKM